MIRLAAGLALFVACAGSHAAIFNVGSGRGCTHPTLQRAIDAAFITPGIDEIRLPAARIEERVLIRDQDLMLRGGFASCTATAPTSTTSLGGFVLNEWRSTVTIRGRGDVEFQGIDFVEGQDHADHSDGYGGALDIGEGPHLVRLDRGSPRSAFRNNGADRGGAISIRGRGNRLQVAQGEFLDNGASASGGAIYCAQGAEILLYDFNEFSKNYARRDGGAIRVENCTLAVYDEGVAGFLENRADGSGGAISITGQHADAILAAYSGPRPLRVQFNLAGRDGGGLDIGSSAHVRVHNARIDDNIAQRHGGGVSIFDNDGSSGDDDATFLMTDAPPAQAQFGRTDGIFPCDADRECSSLSRNSGGLWDAQPGAALHALTVGAGRGTQVSIVGTRIVGNVGTSVLAQSGVSAFGTGASMSIGNSLIADNRIDCALISSVGADTLVIDHSTLAGGGILDGEVRCSKPAAIFADGRVRLSRSIVWTPFRSLDLDRDRLDLFDALLRLDAGETLDFPGMSVDDPRFVDAPGGDFHLATDSPAIDRTDLAIHDDTGFPLFPTDLDALPRAVPMPDSSGPGVADLGAFEVQPKR